MTPPPHKHTPSSKDHAPGFIKYGAELKAKGIDTVACVSVNDAFVMAAWGESLGVGNTMLMLADGNGARWHAWGMGVGWGVSQRRCKGFRAVCPPQC